MIQKKCFMLCLFVLGFIFSGIAQTSTGYKIGAQVANFTLKNVDGKMVSLNDYKDKKGVIVVFTCNHCPFAKKYEDRIIQLNKQYSGKGFPVIAISPNDPVAVPEDGFENMAARAKEHHYTFPYLIDETQETAHAFAAVKTPHAFVLSNEKGAFVLRYAGAIDDNCDEPEKAQKHYVADAANALLEGKNVAVTETKSIGCGIKWKVAKG